MSHRKVTNRAVLAYLERIYGVDILLLKKRIARITEDGRNNGANRVLHDGARYVLSKSGKVVTVSGKHGRLSRRAQRFQRRHK